MNMDCLDIGIIQAFLDGELRQDETARVSGHIATCDACAFMLADAEEESAIVFPALERELNTLVPTQRLWNKINDSIQTERRPFWHKAWAFLTVALMNPSIAVAAVLLIVVGIFAVLLTNRNAPGDVTVAENTPKVSLPTVVTAPAPPIVANTGDTVVTTTPRPAVSIERASYRPEILRVSVTKADYKVTPQPATVNGYMPGEESYIKTISSLNGTVKEQKDDVLRPSERIAYERDMAVVNDTIAKMRTEVKKNPRNASAKEVLYSSYQNKIDLLNSVAQKEELVASLSR